MIKRPRHSTVVAYLALFFAMSGTAAAATGGTFLLGRSNSASTTTTLSNSRGTPLALKGPTSKAPLTVNSKRKVGNLDADLLDGLDSTQLSRRLAVACPSGQAVSAINGASITCVAVSTGSSGPSTPSQGQSKGWTISDVAISQDAAGDFQAAARLTNDNANTQSASFTITVFSGTSIVGTLQATLNSVPPGSTFTGNFTSTNAFTSFDSWTFQTDTVVNG